MAHVGRPLKMRKYKNIIPPKGFVIEGVVKDITDANPEKRFVMVNFVRFTSLKERQKKKTVRVVAKRKKTPIETREEDPWL